MTTELNFRLAEAAQERSILLLSKASGISVEVITKLQAPLQAEEVTEEVLQQLDAIAAALEVQVIDLIGSRQSVPMASRPTAQDVFIDRVVRIVQQRGVELETTEITFSGVEPGEMMTEANEVQENIVLFRVRPECIPYSLCKATKPPKDCPNPNNC